MIKEEGTTGKAEVWLHKIRGLILFSFEVLFAKFCDWIKNIRPSDTKDAMYMRIKDLNGNYHTQAGKMLLLASRLL